MIYYSNNQDKVKLRCVILTILILYPLGLEYECQYYQKKFICIEARPFIEFSELPKNDVFQIANLFAQVSTITTSGTSGYISSTTTL